MNEWNGENNFELFGKYCSINKNTLWKQFYCFHKDKILIQNEVLSIKKCQLIIQSTFKLSNKKGFALMSLRDLSNETNISLGGLYNYIGSKKQLVEMIQQFLPYIFYHYITTKINRDISAWNQLTAFIRGHIFISTILQPWFFFSFMESKNLDASNKEMAKNNEIKSELAISEIINLGINENIFTSNNIFLSTMYIKQLLQGWYIKHQKYKAAKIHCETYAEFVIDQLQVHLNYNR